MVKGLSPCSALQLSRELGVRYNTTWKLKHKVLQVMHERNQKKKLSGRIELDDAYLGGEWPGKRGRDAEHKFPFVAALQADEEGHPQRQEHDHRHLPCHPCSACPRYLSEFEYHSNRRYVLKAMFPRFLTVAVQTPPMPYRFLKLAKSYA
jgi:hypothetical protein